MCWGLRGWEGGEEADGTKDFGFVGNLVGGVTGGSVLHFDGVVLFSGCFSGAAG